MNRATAFRLAVGRRQPVDLHSSLGVDVAESRLAAGVRSRWAGPPDVTTLWMPKGSCYVLGRIAEGRLRACAVGRWRTSWNPVLRARLIPEPTGCRLIGTVGLPLVAILVEAYAALFVAVFVGVGVAMSVGAGHRLDGLAAVGAGVAFAALTVAISITGRRIGRRNEAYLFGWVAERLEPLSGS